MFQCVKLSLLYASVAIATCISSPAAAQSSDMRASFTIGFQGVKSDLTVMMATVMPSSNFVVETQADVEASIGTVTRSGKTVTWKAPATPGRHELTFRQNGEAITLHVFVLTPFKNGTDVSLNGYKIGEYRKTLFRGMQSYAEPMGFIDLSHGPADLKISPHFTLGQFICKQQPGHDPTYLLVNPATLIKLETLLEAADAKGWKADTLHIMSGFRTPHYNRSIGNKTTSSRHLYGGAADIWLDGDGDGRMDDLNGDGLVNKDDARTLAKLAEKLASKGGRNWPSGGVGVYGANSAHGPFVHIDSRGYRARWGH
ncbi:D-Ala-D-Ala carboxypeptidase family metallohydrolase [Litorimonas sp. WD9-15]|uniref:D-Ala-D-Ala carboxypeptidase family metallohydrolase n=1 Tax=Litorimonas sp. WD9-15 TaxID=3418716 RepID=UPI003D0084ED